VRFCSVLVCLLVASASQGQTQRDAARQRAVHFGAAVDPRYLAEARYSGVLAAEFDQVEPENAMKFGPVHPEPDRFNFAQADQVVAFAQAQGMAVRGHTLVWHNQLPKWLTGGGFSPEQLASILRNHIAAVAGRYAGRVYAWDVVNEAFNDDGSLRSTLWSDAPGIGRGGTAYIEQALRWTRAADPAALLFYNDYGAEGMNRKSDAILAMARDFRARGVPLDGIGLQMHFTPAIARLWKDVEENIARITAEGLQVHITELDVRIPVDAAGTAAAGDLNAQAEIYRQVVAICVRHPGCTAIQAWGLTDRHSWIPATYPGLGAALEFDGDYRPKPAYRAVLEALKK